MGATSSIPPRPPREFRFLLTPPRGGATRVMPLALLPALLFLLTPPRGGRRGQKDCILLGFEISTHAPRMGATLELKALGTFSQFLLTPPRGGDKPGNTSSNALGFIFLLTPPHGGATRLFAGHGGEAVGRAYCPESALPAFLQTGLRGERPVAFCFSL